MISQDKSQSESDYYTLKEVKKKQGVVDNRTLWKLIEDGVCPPPATVRRPWKWSKDVYQKFLENRE